MADSPGIAERKPNRLRPVTPAKAGAHASPQTSQATWRVYFPTDAKRLPCRTAGRRVLSTVDEAPLVNPIRAAGRSLADRATAIRMNDNCRRRREQPRSARSSRTGRRSQRRVRILSSAPAPHRPGLSHDSVWPVQGALRGLVGESWDRRFAAHESLPTKRQARPSEPTSGFAEQRTDMHNRSAEGQLMPPARLVFTSW
jgi:hypothetical protein